MSGVVVKNIAERIIAIDTTTSIIDIKSDSTLIAKNKRPSVKSGRSTAIKTVMKKLNQPVSTSNDEWIIVKNEENKIQFDSLPVQERVTPNLNNMGAKDAVFLCEEVGLKVNFSGVGKVISQSIPAGTKINKGQTIELVLAP